MDSGSRRHLGAGVRVGRQGHGRSRRATRGGRARFVGGGRRECGTTLRRGCRGRGLPSRAVLLPRWPIDSCGDPAAASAVALFQPGKRSGSVGTYAVPHSTDRRWARLFSCGAPAQPGGHNSDGRPGRRATHLAGKRADPRPAASGRWHRLGSAARRTAADRARLAVHRLWSAGASVPWLANALEPLRSRVPLWAGAQAVVRLHPGGL